MQIATIEIVPKIHSETGASGFHRWSTTRGACPGSVNLIRDKAPPELDIPDEVRDDGIELHGLGEVLLKERDDVARRVLKAKFQNNKGDLDILLAANKYVAYIDQLSTLPGAELWVEKRFDLGWLASRPILNEEGKETGQYESGLFGTSDAVVYAPFSDFYDLDLQQLFKGPILHVVDLKGGFKGTQAFIKLADGRTQGNGQALYYALGAYYDLKLAGKAVNRIVVHIFQPNVIAGQKISTWSCDEKYLEQFALDLKDDYLATLDPDAPLNPGDYCGLCKGRTVCPELKKPGWVAANAQLRVDGKDPAKVLPSYEIGNEDPGVQFRVAMLAKTWAEAIITRTRAEMNSGKPFEGLKLVAGRNAKVFIDPEKFQADYPREDWPEFYQEPELKSPAQIIQALEEMTDADLNAKSFSDKYLDSKPGQPLVALESDKRAAYNPNTKAQAKATAEWADVIKKPAIPPPPPVVNPLMPPVPFTPVAGIPPPPVAMINLHKGVPPPPGQPITAPPLVSVSFNPADFFKK